MKVVGVTATRAGLTQAQAARARQELSEATDLHHGDCLGGDAELHDIGRAVGLWIEGHPPIDPKQRAWKKCDKLWPEKEYIERNHDIVDCTQRMLAFPKSKVEEMRGSGTWATIRYARRVRRQLLVVYPDGSTSG